jgi:hypothetical protein
MHIALFRQVASWMLLSVLVHGRATAQDTTMLLVDAVPESQATVFVEALGSGVYWSLNYEYTSYESRAFAFHVRLGACIWRLQKSGSFYSFPVHLGWSVGRNHRAEASVGMTPFVVKADNVKGAGVEALFPVLYAGYRFQQANGGLFLRAGALITPLAAIEAFETARGKWVWNPGVSLGTSF